uniref:Cytochrome b-c1 complex subunit 9 n=1 Tax=Monodelphis domestica TaxID=13616 RepID=A0A5F8HLI6_MONDO
MAPPTMLGKVYSLFFRRTSTFALTIAVSVLFFERAFDQGGDAIYGTINQGGFGPFPLSDPVTTHQMKKQAQRSCDFPEVTQRFEPRSQDSRD